MSKAVEINSESISRLADIVATLNRRVRELERRVEQLEGGLVLTTPTFTAVSHEEFKSETE